MCVLQALVHVPEHKLSLQAIKAVCALQAKEIEKEMDAAFVDVEEQIRIEGCQDRDVSHKSLASTCTIRTFPQCISILSSSMS